MVEPTFENTVLMLVAIPGMVAPAASAMKPAIMAYSIRSCPLLSCSRSCKRTIIRVITALLLVIVGIGTTLGYRLPAGGTLACALDFFSQQGNALQPGLLWGVGESCKTFAKFIEGAGQPGGGRDHPRIQNGRLHT